MVFSLYLQNKSTVSLNSEHPLLSQSLQILFATMLLLGSLVLILLLILPIFYLVTQKTNSSDPESPKSYPFIGSLLELAANADRIHQWFSEILNRSPSGTVVLSVFGVRQILTVNPANVEHILKTKFSIYPKGDFLTTPLIDFLGTGIFSVDGEPWKFQRKIASHEFNNNSLRKFVETVVDVELTDRLIPILAAAAANNTVLDLENIFQRFAFDNICRIAFGYDPAYLSPSLPQTDFSRAFEEAETICLERYTYPFQAIWKLKRLLNMGSEKRLKQAVKQVREFAEKIVHEKKQQLQKSKLETTDLLSRLLNSGHSEDSFVIDMVITFILAGETTTAALAWFFWLISCYSQVEKSVLEEIKETQKASVYDEVKDMVYTHASLCETMRLYPPVPANMKQAAEDDVLPDGTKVTKGMRITYHTYTMGRMEKLWGRDWAEFKPERWLKRNENEGKWNFLGMDPYVYPVFQAGPRTCLGKEMAFLQMKSVIVGVVQRFRVVPAGEKGHQPEYTALLTAKIKGGFPVRIEDREGGGL